MPPEPLRPPRPDPEAALPDVEHPVPRAAGPEVHLGVGDDVVDPGTHDASQDRPDEDPVERLLRSAAGSPAATRDPPAEHDPGDDAQRVGADRDGTQVPHAHRRARDEERHHFRDPSRVWAVPVVRSNAVPLMYTVGVPFEAAPVLARLKIPVT